MGEFIALIGKEPTIIGLCLVFVAFIVWSILTDKLVTAKRLEDERERVNAERIEKEKWQAAHATLEKTNAEILKQNGVLLENSRLFVPFIQAFGTGATKYLQHPSGMEGDST